MSEIKCYTLEKQSEGFASICWNAIETLNLVVAELDGELCGELYIVQHLISTLASLVPPEHCDAVVALLERTIL